MCATSYNTRLVLIGLLAKVAAVGRGGGGRVVVVAIVDWFSVAACSATVLADRILFVVSICVHLVVVTHLARLGLGIIGVAAVAAFPLLLLAVVVILRRRHIRALRGKKVSAERLVHRKHGDGLVAQHRPELGVGHDHALVIGLLQLVLLGRCGGGACA